MAFWSSDPTNAPKALNELYDSSERSVAIVGGSIIEQRLSEAIASRLHPHEVTRKKLFRPSGALGSFSVKIDLAFLMQIISDRARRELNIIKDVRNVFAHDLTVESFSDQRLHDMSNGLTMFEDFIAIYLFTDLPRLGITLKSGSEKEIMNQLQMMSGGKTLLVLSRDDPRKEPKRRFIYSIYTFENLLATAAKGEYMLQRPSF